jgi:hypothetical protein
LPFSLAAGNSCDIGVAFAPTSVGAKSVVIGISSDDPDENPVQIGLSGNGLSALLNNPPGRPELLFPANGQTGINTTVTLRWRPVTDPDGDPVSYDVYLCTEADPFNSCATSQARSVVSNRGVSGTTGGLGIPGNLLLLVGGLTLVGGCVPYRRKVLMYAVSLILLANLVACHHNHSDNDDMNMTFTAFNLGSNTTYYWGVVARDDQGGATASSIWRFTTRDVL